MFGRPVGDVTVANAQRQGRNYPKAKKEENLPTDKTIVSAWGSSPV